MPEASPHGITKVVLSDDSGATYTASGGSGGGGAVTVADGADITQGTTTDAAWVSGAGTVVALLKKIAAAGGSAVSISDGSDVAQGTTTDTAWVSGSGTVISLLKKIASAGGSAVSIADGSDAAQGTTTDTSSANTVVGILKAIKAAVTGTLPVSGTFWQATQPVSAATLPLPSGASTAAKQPALGTAGSASTDVLTVQGIASGTAQPVSAASLPLPTGAAADTSVQSVLTGVGAPADIAWVSGSGSAIALLKGIFGKLAGTLAVSGTFWQATQPVSGTVTANAGSGTLAVSAAGLPLPSGASTSAKQPAIGTAGAASSDVLSVQGVTSMTPLKVDGSAVTQPVSGTITTTPPSNASTNLAQVAGAATATGHGTASGALRVELPTDGTGVVGLAAGSAAIGSVTTELTTGLTTFGNTALSSTKTQVKASAGKLYGWMIHNPSAATVFIQVWDLASGSITVGTTTPTYVIPIPAGASANVFGERGITHSTAINVAATTTATGSTAPATAAVVSLFYI